MSTKMYKPEQIVNPLRQIEVEIANGKTTPRACRDAQIRAQTYYRWRKEYGGLILARNSATIRIDPPIRVRRRVEGCFWKACRTLAPSPVATLDFVRRGGDQNSGWRRHWRWMRNSVGEISSARRRR